MGLHLIVDGYNLIGTAGSCPLSHLDSLESAREEVIEQLRQYKRVKAARITLVFDAAGGSRGSPRKEVYKGIQVMYALPGEKADDAIIRLVGRSPSGVVVVTSDRELGRACQGLGAAVVSSREFQDRLAMASTVALKGGADDEDDGAPKGHGEKRGPAKRVPSRQRRDQKRLKKL
jgi:uncharacterized protein